jgi:hypothetical protein
MEFSNQPTSPISSSDQEQIDRIKKRLAAIAADQSGREPIEPKPWNNYQELSEGVFRLEVRELTQDELKSLNPNLPKSHSEILKQLGVFTLGYHGYLIIDTFVPRAWNESDYCRCSATNLVLDRLPDEHNYLYTAREGSEGYCFGYHIGKKPFELEAWDFADCRPYKAEQKSYLGLIEEYIFQSFEGTSLA